MKLYQRIGGEDVINDAMVIFYRKAVADPKIGPFFAGIDFEKQRIKQKAFLVMAFGGESNYDGAGLRNAHKRLVEEEGLSDEHFDAVVGHLKDTLKAVGANETDIGEAANIIESYRNEVLNR